MSAFSEDIRRASRAEIDADIISLRMRAKKIEDFTRSEDAAIDFSIAKVKAKATTLKERLAAVRAEVAHDGSNAILKAEQAIFEAELTVTDAKVAAFEAYTKAFKSYRSSYEKEIEALSDLHEVFTLNADSDNISRTARLMEACREQKTKVDKMGGYMVRLMVKIENARSDIMANRSA